MEFQPILLGEYDSKDIILFRDDKLGYCIRHDNKTYALPYYCLGKDTQVYTARKAIERGEFIR